MTLPDACDFCGFALAPWDPEEDTPCGNCGNVVPTWEHLTPEHRRQRMTLIARRQAITAAPTVDVRRDVL